MDPNLCQASHKTPRVTEQGLNAQFTKQNVSHKHQEKPLVGKGLEREGSN